MIGASTKRGTNGHGQLRATRSQETRHDSTARALEHLHGSRFRRVHVGRHRPGHRRIISGFPALARATTTCTVRVCHPTFKTARGNRFFRK
jgi:hypothetical protein